MKLFYTDPNFIVDDSGDTQVAIKGKELNASAIVKPVQLNAGWTVTNDRTMICRR